MTRLALPRKCGALGARGLISSARPCSDKRCARILGNKIDPLTSERIIWRREQPQLEWPAIGTTRKAYKLDGGAMREIQDMERERGSSPAASHEGTDRGSPSRSGLRLHKRHPRTRKPFP